MVTYMTNGNKRKIERIFTSREKLIDSPVIKIFGDKKVKKFMRITGEKGLHYPDFRYLLCEDQPVKCKINKNCIEKPSSCKKSDNCVQMRYKLWDEIIPPEKRPEPFFKNRPRLSEHIKKLRKERFLIRVKEGYYEKGKIDLNEENQNQIKKISRFISKCPPGDFDKIGGLSFLFMYKEFLSNSKQEFDEYISKLNNCYNELINIYIKSYLNWINDSLKYELSLLKTDEEKIRLWHYVNQHILIQLANNEIDEKIFSRELNKLKRKPYKIEPQKYKNVLSLINEEDKLLKPIKREIAILMWEEGIRSPIEAYLRLIEEGVLNIPSPKQKEIKSLIERDINFSNVYPEYLELPYNVIDELPIIVLSPPKISDYFNKIR